jgi:predicted amidohydrolase
MATTNELSSTIRSSNVRAAVVQAAPALFDTPKSLERLADLSADAAKQRAELVVFPEAFIGGYPKGHDCFAATCCDFGPARSVAILREPRPTA